MRSRHSLLQLYARPSRLYLFATFPNAKYPTRHSRFCASCSYTRRRVCAEAQAPPRPLHGRSYAEPGHLPTESPRRHLQQGCSGRSQPAHARLGRDRGRAARVSAVRPQLVSQATLRALELLLRREECEAYVRGVWDWLESLGTGIDRNDPATWRAPTWPASFRGIINSLGVSHQPFVWRVRKADRIRQVCCCAQLVPCVCSLSVSFAIG